MMAKTFSATQKRLGQTVPLEGDGISSAHLLVKHSVIARQYGDIHPKLISFLQINSFERKIQHCSQLGKIRKGIRPVKVSPLQIPQFGGSVDQSLFVDPHLYFLEIR